ncbi:MAG: hypothetical protein Q8Q62_04740 [Mesorhizobium sp.]|nr:hypothetical protein [Mesorhizobium sp.]
MTVFSFHCTNGSGFHAEPGHSITAHVEIAAASWVGGNDFLGVTEGYVGFSNRGMELQDSGFKPVAELLLQGPKDMFETIPMGYISGMVIHRPRQGVSPSGWRWMMFSRI